MPRLAAEMVASSAPLRRLQAVAGHAAGPLLSAAEKDLLLVLPDGGEVNALLSSVSEGCNEILLEDSVILEYTISETEKLSLDVSSVGTPYHGTTSHLPKYHLVALNAPVSTNAPGKNVSIDNLWVGVYALFTLYHSQENIPIILLSINNAEDLKTYLLDSGLAQRYHAPQPEKSKSPQDILFLSRSAFWQGAGTTGFHHRSWNMSLKPNFPSVMTFTRNQDVIAMHPLRPSKPQPGEMLYRRWCSAAKQSFDITYFDIDGVHDGSTAQNGGVSRHLAAFHRWQNDDRVNSAWDERGSLEAHREYVESLLVDPRVLPCMLSWDGELMGYAEIVYVKEDHVAQHYPTGVVPGDWERGMHVLVGEDKFVGNGRSELWVRSIVHYCFLTDSRTDRVSGEPSVSNQAIQRVAVNSGFHVETVFDFPYKRSTLILNPRERFFKLCRLR